MATKREYKVGDVVRLPSVRPDGWNSFGILDHYLNKAVTITAIEDGWSFKFEGSGKWCFNLADIAAVVKPVEGFKVGDTVKLVTKPDRHWAGNMCKYLGNTVTLTAVFEYGFDFSTNDGWSFNLKDIAELVQQKEDAVMKTEYTALKNLSCGSIFKGSPCKAEFENYIDEMKVGGFGFFDNPPVDFVVKCAADHPSWMPWLITHEYIREEKKVNYEPVGVGDVFTINDYKAMLVILTHPTVRFVHIGDAWCDFNEVSVGNTHSITLEEFKRLTSKGCNDSWKEIYATRIPYKVE